MATGTQSAPRAVESASSAPALRAEDLYRLSVEQYEAMVEQGILGEDERVELLDGVLVQTMPKKPRHRVVKRRLIVALSAVVPAGWFVEDQEPIRLANSQPEPDVMIVRGSSDDYAERHPSAGEVGLVIEIADTSLAMDQGAKLRAYAQAGVPSYWIVNLLEGRVETYAAPEGSAYRSRVDYPTAGAVPLVLEGRACGEVAAGPLLA